MVTLPARGCVCEIVLITIPGSASSGRSPSNYSADFDRPSALSFKAKLRRSGSNDRLGWAKRWPALSPAHPARIAAAERNVSWTKTEGRVRQTASTRRSARRERSMAVGDGTDQSRELRHRNYAPVGLRLETGGMLVQNFAILWSGGGGLPVRCWREQCKRF